MTLRPGDALETAIWMDGTETEELKSRFERDLQATLAGMAADQGVIIGPLMMVEKKPGEDRVPPVPDGVQGMNVRLLVGEARVVGQLPTEAPWNFVMDLDSKDLRRLRKLTRRAAPSSLTDEECDEIINEIGPDSALRTLRERVH